MSGNMDQSYNNNDYDQRMQYQQYLQNQQYMQNQQYQNQQFQNTNNANANANNDNVQGNITQGNTINYSSMNPKNFDMRVKTQMVNQNIYHSGYGDYKVCPVFPSIAFPYNKSYNPPAINSITKVIIDHTHGIDTIDTLSDHGLNSLTSKNQIPMIIYPVGKEFIGSNLESREGIHDETMILRTNYPYVIKKQTDLFDTRSDYFVIYSNPITVIRDSNYNSLHYDNVFKMGVATLYANTNHPLIKDKSGITMLTSHDLLMLQIRFETAFQAAICGSHPMIIIPLLSVELNIPIDDQILIINHCILKFGHLFKAIMICVPPYESKEIVEYLNSKIIKPLDLTKKIDGEIMAQNMAQHLITDNEINTDSDTTNNKLPLSDAAKKKKSKENLTKKMASMNEKDRMDMLKQMIRANKQKKSKSHKHKHHK